MKPRPENAVAILNGCLVLFVPLVFLLVAPIVFEGDTNTSVTVRPAGTSRLMSLSDVRQVALVLAPFAVLAGWRTWVHATRWQTGRGTGWRGVVEAGTCGFGTALLMLLPAILTRPTEAPPYVVFYGGIALLMGILVGLVLRAAALACLKLLQHPHSSVSPSA